MIFPAIPDAPWWKRILARLFGHTYLAYDQAIGEGTDLTMLLTIAEWHDRFYIIASRRVCRKVCKLGCWQRGRCKAESVELPEYVRKELMR